MNTYATLCIHCRVILDIEEIRENHGVCDFCKEKDWSEIEEYLE